jgi:hypothetical protein
MKIQDNWQLKVLIQGEKEFDFVVWNLWIATISYL